MQKFRKIVCNSLPWKGVILSVQREKKWTITSWDEVSFWLKLQCRVYVCPACSDKWNHAAWYPPYAHHWNNKSNHTLIMQVSLQISFYRKSLPNDLYVQSYAKLTNLSRAFENTVMIMAFAKRIIATKQFDSLTWINAWLLAVFYCCQLN